MAYFLRYLAERASFAEEAIKDNLGYLVESPEIQRLFNNPSVHGVPLPTQGEASLKTISRGLLELRVEQIGRSGLFDEAYYAGQFVDGLPSHIDSIEHYLLQGWIAAKDPNPLFSTRYYLAQYPDVRASGIDPLTHYIERGSSEMRNPHALFRSYYYASQNANQLPQDMTWLAYFLTHSDSETSPHPIFSVQEYASRTRTDPQSAAQALLHYVLDGWRQSIDASPFFKAKYYYQQIKNQSFILEPFTHYSIFGVSHSINPHPLFDVKRYRSIVKDLDNNLDPLIHYLWKGEASSVSPSMLFDVDFYRQKYKNEISEKGPLWHYLTEGARRDYLPNQYFDPAKYRSVFMANGSDPETSPLEHFINFEQSSVFQNKPDSIIESLGQISGPSSQQVSLASAASSTLQVESIAPDIREFVGKLPHMEGRPNIMLVAHIASAHLFGGERSLLDMLEGLAGIGANAFVVLPRNAPDYTNMIRRRCERVFVFEYGWWRKQENTTEGARLRFRKIIQTHNIQAVHANTIMLRECIEAAREEEIASVVHVRELITHDEDLVEIIGGSVEEIVAEVRSRTDWIIGNSAATAKAFFKPDMTSVIPNTINVADMDIPNVVEDGRVRFGLISSNIPKKGVFDLVEVARLCRETAPNAEFLLIGPDSLAIIELKQSAERGELPESIRFPGYAASPSDAIGQVNVVLNLSHFAESFGRTVLEAMVARRPVIAYDWGALPELIEPGRTGFLTPYKDVKAVARHVAELCASPGLLIEMGESARAVALAKYTLDSYRENFRQAYARILPNATFELARSRSQPMVRAARQPGLKLQRPDPRIAYFCWHFPVPSETFVLNELRVLVAQGADVIVFCRQSPFKTFVPDFPIQFERIDTPYNLATRLKETGRTIVHAHFVYPTVTNMVWPACEEAQIPFTFMAHAQDIFVHKNDESNRLAEIGNSPWCLKLFTLSRFHHDFIVERGFPRNKIVINPNAVDTRRFAEAAVVGKEDRTAKRIVAVHRFVKKKGLSLLIQAAPLVQDLGLDIDIYGYGDLETEYRELIAQHGITNVTIHGAISQTEVADVMASADLFACPAIRTEDGNMDGIPTSIVESMVARVPVLTTAISGIPDLVEDEITGIICEPTPEGIADAIRRFYNLPTLQVRAILEEAHKRAVTRHDAGKLVRTLRRVWENATVDIVIVAWNNLTELRMVVDSIRANTALPYHLIICDNLSERENVYGYLESLWAAEERVTVVHNNRNAMVGPGTNLAMAQGISDTVIYMCGKEGVSFRNGWENAFIEAFDAPDIGLVGTLGYSPSYRIGSQYPTGIRLFDKFRNPAFATDNPDRPFRHIQGGLFAMRRSMVEQIGGFSDAVPHDYTDVEYSFYAESCGWKLGEAKGVLALFNKSRPTLSQRFCDDVQVAHPVLPHQLNEFRGLLDGRLRHCNICDWYGEAFERTQSGCPECGSTPMDRSLFRWLSEGTLMYRRLPTLGVGLSGKMAAVWAEQFQGPRMALRDLTDELRRVGRLPNAPGRLHAAVLRIGEITPAEIRLLAIELQRVLAKDGIVVLQLEVRPAAESDSIQKRFEWAMLEVGFSVQPSLRYASRAVGFSFLSMWIFSKA
jgi:glycosyltransferase involved in cell wall biosynthesis